jgi:hypothetical protein
MAGVEQSEYGGAGPMPNGVFPKGNDALSASDKLRLLSTTGQTEDSHMPVDPGYWQGVVRFDPNEVPKPTPEQVERAQRIIRDNANRYKETKI